MCVFAWKHLLSIIILLVIAGLYGVNFSVDKDVTVTNNDQLVVLFCIPRPIYIQIRITMRYMFIIVVSYCSHRDYQIAVIFKREYKDSNQWISAPRF